MVRKNNFRFSIKDLSVSSCHIRFVEKRISVVLKQTDDDSVNRMLEKIPNEVYVSLYDDKDQEVVRYCFSDLKLVSHDLILDYKSLCSERLEHYVVFSFTYYTNS